MNSSAPAILVIRFSSLGDVVLTGPVMTALRRQWPQARLCVAVKRAYADAVRAHPDVDEVLTLKEGQSVVAFARQVRARGFDRILDLHGNLRSRIVSALSGASLRVRYRKAVLARRLYVGWRWGSPQLSRHTLDRYLEAARRLGASDASLPPESILLIQTAFLGDAVLTTPLLEALRERWPSVKLTVVCTPEIADIFRAHPARPEIVIFDKRGRQSSWRERWRFARNLGGRRFDCAILPHRSLTSAFLALAAGIPRRIGFARGEGRWLLTDAVAFEWNRHDAERNLALLTPLGGPPASVRFSLKADAASEALVAARLADEGVSVGEPLLGINAGSVWATKRWLPERFAEVADRAARELGMRPVFIGATKDQAVVADVRRSMTQASIDWCGKTSLKELIALVSRCEIFLTNDSGPMHIAAACGIPTVALFGPTTRELGFFPWGAGHRVIEKNIPCRPCGLHGHARCPLGHFECMKQISSAEVFQAIRAYHPSSLIKA